MELTGWGYRCMEDGRIENQNQHATETKTQVSGRFRRTPYLPTYLSRIVEIQIQATNDISLKLLQDMGHSNYVMNMDSFCDSKNQSCLPNEPNHNFGSKNHTLPDGGSSLHKIWFQTPFEIDQLHLVGGKN